MSPRTISRFFNHPEKLASATRKRIAAAVRRLEYRPNAYANRVSRGAHETLAVMAAVSEEDGLSELHRLLLSHISVDLAKRRRDLLLIGVGADNWDEVIAEGLLRSKFEALLLLTPMPDPILAELARSPLAKVTLNWAPARSLPQHCYVGIDYYHSSRTYALALLEKGYRRFGYVGPAGPSPRKQALWDVVESHGKKAWVEHLVWPAATPPRQAAARTVETLLRGRSKLDLLYCFSDGIALHLLQAFWQAGFRVPDEVAVAGFDGIAAGQSACPALTTMAQPWQAMAREAIAFLLGEGQGAQRFLEAEILWRASA